MMSEVLGAKTLEQVQRYKAMIRAMDTLELIEYTLSRDHCLALERELAERLQQMVGSPVQVQLKLD